MIGNGDKGPSFLEKHWSPVYFWVYVIHLAVWAVVVFRAIDEPLGSEQ